MDDETAGSRLDEQLDAIGEAEGRARVALFVSALAAAAVLCALWNAYLSWDGQWSESTPVEPSNWGERVLLEQQIQTWQQSNDVSLSLLGIHLSASDAAVFGAAVLLVLAFWVQVTIRHLNGEVATVMRANARAPLDDRRRIFDRIRAGMVFEPPLVAAPIDTLDGDVQYVPRTRTSAFMSHVLLLLPAVTVALIIGSDLYFAFFYVSPFRQNAQSAWTTLSPRYRTQLIAIDTFAAIAELFIIRFTVSASRYHRATLAIVREFWHRLHA